MKSTSQRPLIRVKAACTWSHRPRKLYNSASMTPICRPSSLSIPATRSAFPTPGRTFSMSCSRVYQSAHWRGCEWTILEGGRSRLSGRSPLNDAEPGDVLEVRHKRIRPYEWGATFNNPATLGTGLLSQDYPQGQIKYVDLDLRAMTSKFMPNINIPLKPFQGTLGVAPPDGYFRPLSPGVTNAVPPGPHAGNLISASCPRDRRSIYQCGSRERSSIRATAMRCRAMARSASPPSRPA